MCVASFAAVQRKDSEKLLSYCVWSQNVDSLLPRTQAIVVVSDGSVVASGEWDHVADIVRHLVVADETYYPVHYRVPNFSSKEQLAAIGRVQPFHRTRSQSILFHPCILMFAKASAV